MEIFPGTNRRSMCCHAILLWSLRTGRLEALRAGASACCQYFARTFQRVRLSCWTTPSDRRKVQSCGSGRLSTVSLSSVMRVMEKPGPFAHSHRKPARPVLQRIDEFLTSSPPNLLKNDEGKTDPRNRAKQTQSRNTHWFYSIAEVCVS
jgi:hypothetical protein